MSKVSVVGTFTCQDGKADEMEAVLTKMVGAASSEPGVEIYSYHRGEDDTFWFFALMADEEAMQNHGQSEAMQAAMSAFGPLVAGAVGLGLTLLKISQRSPASRQLITAASTIGRSDNPGSVTSNGALTPSSRQASGSSATRPGPTRMAVG